MTPCVTAHAQAGAGTPWPPVDHRASRAAWLRQVRCSEARARRVGRRTRRRGGLSSAEVQTGRIESAARRPSETKLGRLWAVRGCSTAANDDQQRPPGARTHRPRPAKTQFIKIPGKTQGKKK